MPYKFERVIVVKKWYSHGRTGHSGCYGTDRITDKIYSIIGTILAAS